MNILQIINDSRSDVKYYRIPANLPKILDGKFYNNILPNKKTRGGIQATCTSCFSVIAGTAKSTGNFLSHIKRRHKDLLGNCQVYCSAKNILPDEFDLNLPFYKQPAFYDHPVKYAKRAVKVYKKKSIKATEIKVEGKNGNSCSGGSGSAGGRHDDNDSRSVDYIDEILKIKCEPTRKDSCSSNNSITTDRSNSNTETNATPRITTISTSERKPANGVYKEPPALLKVLK